MSGPEPGRSQGIAGISLCSSIFITSIFKADFYFWTGHLFSTYSRDVRFLILTMYGKSKSKLMSRMILSKCSSRKQMHKCTEIMIGRMWAAEVWETGLEGDVALEEASLCSVVAPSRPSWAVLSMAFWLSESQFCSQWSGDNIINYLAYMVHVK